MKYKITVAELRPSTEGYDADTIFLQVLDLDESPAAEIARLLNPEVEYEETEEDEEGLVPKLTHIERHIENAVNHGVPAGDMRFKANKEFEERNEPAPSHTGRRPGYDRGAMIEELKANVLTVAQLADKYGVPKQTVYNVRNRYVNPAEIAPDLDPEPTGPRQEPVDPEPTAYMAARETLEERKSVADINLEKQIEEMVAEGCSMTELEMMFPSVPVSKLREIFESFVDR